jgi:hypothetical protein
MSLPDRPISLFGTTELTSDHISAPQGWGRQNSAVALSVEWKREETASTTVTKAWKVGECQSRRRTGLIAVELNCTKLHLFIYDGGTTGRHA